MKLVRSIGGWSLVALMVNGIIGSGIFGLSGPLIATMGRASPLVMLVAGLLMAVIVLCFAEVGSRFSEAGGVYLYVRTAFGKFVGLQIGWFWFLAIVGGAATNANLCVDHLSVVAPWAGEKWPRLLVLTGLFLIPAVVNYRGTRRGTLLSNGFTLAKLLPLALLIVLGMWRFSRHFEVAPLSEFTTPGWAVWINMLLLLSFAYGGFEDATTAAGEVREPQRIVPLAMLTALGVCIAVYTLLQFVVVATLGKGSGDHALTTAAEVLLGHGGAMFVEVAIMISTYGWVSASLLNAPRFLFSMAKNGEFPSALGRLHPRFATPHISILFFAILAWVLAVTGSFRWCTVLSAGAGMVFYGAVCAALPRLRQIQSTKAGFLLPGGWFFSVCGVAICVALLTQLHTKEALLMSVTVVLATANWWWVRRGVSSQDLEPVPEVAES